MSLEQFLDDPWKATSLNKLYTDSFLHMRPAPEYANGEVILASLYRNVGFADAAGQVAEAKVPSNGTKLNRMLERGRSTSNSPADVPLPVWRNILSALRSPRQPNQSTRRVLQIAPIVPDAAIYSLSARLRGSPWNPGELIRRLVLMGTVDDTESNDTWTALHRALSVKNDDDLWARFLDKEFQAWRPSEVTAQWTLCQSAIADDGVAVPQWRSDPASVPANRFCKDLEYVISLKGILTRRQWISVVESLLRLGSASHVLWICSANQAVHKLLESALRGQVPDDPSDVKSVLESAVATWKYGQVASPKILEHARDFVRSRLWINLLLWHFSDLLGDRASLGNPEEIFRTCQIIQEYTSPERTDRYFAGKLAVVEQDPRKSSCKRGIGKNVIEFIMHALRQRPTSEVGMESYDQGFVLRKKGAYSGARWIVSLGPVAVLTLVHCCTSTNLGPRTVEDLCNHLRLYGINASPQEVAGSDLGQTLRNLGLVLDSPDAEGGMVLVSPFQNRLEASS